MFSFHVVVLLFFNWAVYSGEPPPVVHVCLLTESIDEVCVVGLGEERFGQLPEVEFENARHSMDVRLPHQVTGRTHIWQNTTHTEQIIT